MTGEAYRATFGTPLDEWRRCSYAGCEWHARMSLLCRDHGGHARDMEWRTDATGRAEYRGGYTGPIIPATRVPRG